MERQRPVRESGWNLCVSGAGAAGEVVGCRNRPAVGLQDPTGSSPGGLPWRHSDTGLLLLLPFIRV